MNCKYGQIFHYVVLGGECKVNLKGQEHFDVMFKWGDSYVMRYGAVVPWWLICVYFYTKTILYEHYSILDLSIPSPLGKESFRLSHSISISRSSFVHTYIHRAVIIIASKAIGASNGNTHRILKKILLTNISHIALKSR